MSTQLKGIVAQLEDAIIVISGPALAISGIIAGVDLVTGGNILKNMPIFTLAWAITLLLTLDFQVLCLGVRAHRVYVSHKSGQRKVVEIVIAVIIAAAISYVSIQMQSIIARVNAENISLDMAAAQLGINTVWLIWERSTLVLVLIFMAGWLREHDAAVVESQAPMIDTAQIVNELDARLQQRMEQKIEAVFERVQITIEQAVQNTGELPAIPERTGTNTASDLVGADESEQGANNYERVKAYMATHPGAPVREVAIALTISTSTASKWMQRARVEYVKKVEEERNKQG